MMIRYTISYSKPARQYIPITAVFPTDDRYEMYLQFPAWRPGRYELGNFAKNLRLFKVTGANGKLIPFRKISKDCWHVECKGQKSIFVSYQYFAAELNAGSTFMDDRQLYVNPVNCLVYVKELVNTPCLLELDIPSNFTVACSANHDGKTVEASNYDELTDSPFIASNSLQMKTYEVNGITFHLWFQGDIIPDWPRLLCDFEKFTRLQLAQFSRHRSGFSGMEFNEYHFLYQILPVKSYHGVEHLKNTVMALGPGRDVMTIGYDDLLGVSSHELYHSWNIKSIRPVEMYPYDYSRENFSRLGYVCEGVTTYLGDLFLCLSHVKDFNWYQAEIAKLFQKHFDNFGRFNYSVADSSWDTWLDGYVPGAPDRKVSIYTEGALLSLATDLKIRHLSDNKRSIHDVMMRLYEEFALKGRGYSESDFEEIVFSVAGVKLKDYFDGWYRGTNSFEPLLTEVLAYAGLELTQEANQIHSQSLLGLKVLQVNQRDVVQQIYPGSNGDLACVMVNDEIIAVNGIRSIGKLEELLNHFHERNIVIGINRMGRLLELECPNTNKSYFPVYGIRRAQTPSAMAKRIFKSWCGWNWDETAPI